MTTASGPATAIRLAAASDAAKIAAIYNHYVEHTVVTFEEEPVMATEMARRMDVVRAAELPWLVAEQQGSLVGYAYAARWHTRSAYRHSAEVTVYLSAAHVGRGLGTQLYARLLPMLEQRGIHTVIGGVTLPNAASVALHERFGLRKVAHFAEVGFKADRWLDVGYWQRTL